MIIIITHFCQFYQTKEELIDILVPYLSVLKITNFCTRITSKPLDADEALEVLEKAALTMNISRAICRLKLYPVTNGTLRTGF